MQPKGSFCVKKWSFFVHGAGMKNIMHSSPLLKISLTVVIFFCILIQNKNFYEKAAVELPLDCVYMLPRECGFKLHIFCTAKIFL